MRSASKTSESKALLLLRSINLMRVRCTNARRIKWAGKAIGGLASAAMLSAFVSAASPRTPADDLKYNRDIRPILSENCFPCHGPDSAARKAGLRLDRFEEATAPRKDKGPAIIPHKPDQSELVRRIFMQDEDDIMPPAKT